MTKQYILVLDHGTTSIRACILNDQGYIIARGQQALAQYYPQPGWVEQDPMDLWRITLQVVESAFHAGSLTWESIAAIGLTNQRETIIAWDRTTGQPLHPAIVWQCRRTASLCDNLKAQGLETTIRQKTGLVIDPYFSATKIQWLFQNVPAVSAAADQGCLMLGTVDTWILWHLSGQQAHVTDPTNASRTMLFDIHTQQWDDDLLAIFGVPKTALAAVKPSNSILAETSASLTAGRAIPIAAVMGDQQAALYGQRCWQPGQAKSTYGTGAFLMMNTGQHAVENTQGLLTTLACDAQGNPCYALEGAILIAGGALEWLKKQWQAFADPAEIDPLVTTLSDNQGVYLVPAFTGLGAPYWQADVRGLVCGMTQDTGKAHLVRAALEAMVYQTQTVLHAMQNTGTLQLPLLRVDGGVTRANFLCQWMANMLAVPVVRSDDPELTAKGVGYLAGLTVGFWPSVDALSRLPEQLETFEPQPGFDPTPFESGWRAALAKARLM